MSVAYAWQKLYDDAALQTDFEKLPGDIAKAEKAMKKTLAENPLIGADEFDAIRRGLNALAVLKAEIKPN